MAHALTAKPVARAFENIGSPIRDDVAHEDLHTIKMLHESLNVLLH